MIVYDKERGEDRRYEATLTITNKRVFVQWDKDKQTTETPLAQISGVRTKVGSFWSDGDLWIAGVGHLQFSVATEWTRACDLITSLIVH